MFPMSLALALALTPALTPALPLPLPLLVLLLIPAASLFGFRLYTGCLLLHKLSVDALKQQSLITAHTMNPATTTAAEETSEGGERQKCENCANIA